MPSGPTLSAAKKQSKPPPLPMSTTTSPGCNFAEATGAPQPKPMLAFPCHPLDRSSSV
eukprot:CAMPEP_0169296918 /NCGR_PEP_ID=MMETSP1016-20121227/65415_1 /TAXON_ID=342587 /ORGANISM="Karlodinium micrum, Strain CCMP2283" /LENGTH=57 /DNA_ID=CAMNT_0009388379 /DNA_START=63 /DNA_END=236 /DNA_ORIENTATION=+